jgi:ABC-type amino acid transport system permease subunit
MTVSILIGIIFLSAGIFILSPGLSKGLKVRTQVGRYLLVKGIIGLISLMILITVTIQENWYAELWRVVVFIFALLQLISTIFTMNFWDGITDFVRKYPLMVSLVLIALGLLLISPLE